MTAANSISRLTQALPFWLSLGFVPLVWIGAVQGGWWLILLPTYGWGVFTLMDLITGLNLDNPDTETPLTDLFWYRLITLIWFPVQVTVIFSTLWYVSATGHLHWFELLSLFFGIGVMSGVIGIVYAHELMHQKPRVERWLADLLLACVLYSHFRSEHMLVHHRYVGTPRDPVTARYNEGFQHYFYRVLRDCPPSAFRAEAAMLARKGLPAWHISNPFWRYAALQLGFVALAYAIFGWVGVGLFIWQAFIAIWQLELTNYIEHYALTRQHLGDGKYEPVRPHHSWNASHRASNWLMINLQRHSDHHYKPDRRFPLLQTYATSEAPQLPYGYPAMTTLALFPPLWRRAMNPKVRAWRRRFYPQVTDWSAYDAGSTPLPRGAV
ncbi:alkane 1-monooxygenase [Roseicitreum antarcticum]|uniref:Alkane 1-monooxygenase n=1 Tax=Roseicitreum antarcticum TaxID=564137 RepID=A0A1H2X815_9RHOB|nr:alkane 1-monooxygenase [Roseicitreum antarcticum]SDW89010.1 alkane 1-monooxygenase [Roseicitreum antarcticum]